MRLLAFFALFVVASSLPPTLFTYTLTESVGGFIFWTTSTIRKVLSGDPNPTAAASGINVAGARGEWESFQVVVATGAPNDFSVEWRTFPTLGTTQVVNAFRALFLPVAGGIHPEELVAVANASVVPRTAGGNTIVWFNVFIPRDAVPGDHLSSISIAGTVIPLKLYVFNFSMPLAPKFHTQANKGISSVTDQNTLFDLRLSPTSATWPSGPKPQITWLGSQLGQCSVFDDESTHEAPPFQCLALSKKFVLGNGWTENPRATNVGFGRWMAYQFVSNSQTRPATWCGISLDAAQLGAASCTDLTCLDSPYNSAYGAYLTALQAWLTSNGLLSKSYIYIQNEPQGAPDYKLAALLSRVHKKYAPGIKIAVSEQPRPEIFNDTQFGPAGIDIWIATPDEYHKPGNIALGNARIAVGEEVWLYSLPQHLNPYWNPSRSDYSGLNTRIVTWSSWAVRATGWAYYDFGWNSGNPGGFFSSANVPTMKTHILRDAIDDFDYLHIANSNNYPAVGMQNSVDLIVNSVAPTLATWNRHDPDAQQKLRNDLGLFIEGKLACAPILSTAICPAGTHARKNWFINFQANPDPYPAGSIDPKFEGADGIKVSWTSIKYGATAWAALNSFGSMGRFLYGFRNCAAPALQQAHLCTYIYDDFGRTNLFNFGIENGLYDVTVSFSYPGRGAVTDISSIYVEGVQFWDAPPNASPMTITKQISVSDCMLTVQFGVFNMYTFLSSLSIVPAGGNATAPCGSPVLPFNTTLLTTPPGVTFVGSSNGLSGGAIAGIVIGILIAVAVAVVLIVFLSKKAAAGASSSASTPYNAF